MRKGAALAIKRGVNRPRGPDTSGPREGNQSLFVFMSVGGGSSGLKGEVQSGKERLGSFVCKEGVSGTCKVERKGFGRRG